MAVSVFAEIFMHDLILYTVNAEIFVRHKFSQMASICENK